jgi:hypothetical protein
MILCVFMIQTETTTSKYTQSESWLCRCVGTNCFPFGCCCGGCVVRVSLGDIFHAAPIYTVLKKAHVLPGTG